jgi:positive regulator of sigma E activity
MTIAWDKVLPVIVSIGVIILVAILRQYSRQFAAIAATMPLNIPLGMWIVYAGAEDKQAALSDFSQAVLVNIIPTVIFMIVAWQTTRAGWDLMPTIALGYVAWAISLVCILLLRRILGI